MVYNSFEELNRNYPDDREKMTESQEQSYVSDCFDTYENIGFTKGFVAIYDENKNYDGHKFKVLGRVSTTNGEADLECLPMWHIQFDDGVKMDAYPEEICIAEQAS